MIGSKETGNEDQELAHFAEELIDRFRERYNSSDYRTFECNFIEGFVSEFVMESHDKIQTAEATIDDELMIVSFVDHAHAYMTGAMHEVKQYHQIFTQLCEHYYEKGYLQEALYQDREYLKMVQNILKEVHLEVKLSLKTK